MDYGMPTLLELDSIESNAVICKKLGLQFIELNMNLPICSERALSDIHTLNEIKKKYGIYFTIHLDENLNVADFNERVADAYTDTVLNIIELAKELEVPTLTMHMNKGIYFTLPDKKVYLFEKYEEYYLKKMRSFRDSCAEAIESYNNMFICIENTSGYPDFIRNIEKLLLESASFGLTFDIGHSHTAGNIDEPFILEHEDRLRHFHIHDALGDKNHLPLGEGEIDLRSRLELAAQNGCRCVLEIKTVSALEKSVEWLRKHIG